MNKFSFDVSELPKYVKELSAGDEVLLSGTVYTARDAAHKRIEALIDEGRPLPFDLHGAVIYYAGPTPEREGYPIGSCGPTTSSRMDVFSPLLMDNGLLGMIGKGPRNRAVVESMKKNGAVYFCAIGGAGALAAKCITECEVIAFPELGCESVKRLRFCDFPLVVGIDAKGGSMFGK